MSTPVRGKWTPRAQYTVLTSRELEGANGHRT